MFWLRKQTQRRRAGARTNILKALCVCVGVSCHLFRHIATVIYPTQPRRDDSSKHIAPVTGTVFVYSGIVAHASAQQTVFHLVGKMAYCFLFRARFQLSRACTPCYPWPHLIVSFRADEETGRELMTLYESVGNFWLRHSLREESPHAWSDKFYAPNHSVTRGSLSFIFTSVWARVRENERVRSFWWLFRVAHHFALTALLSSAARWRRTGFAIRTGRIFMDTSNPRPSLVGSVPGSILVLSFLLTHTLPVGLESWQMSDENEWQCWQCGVDGFPSMFVSLDVNNGYNLGWAAGFGWNGIWSVKGFTLMVWCMFWSTWTEWLCELAIFTLYWSTRINRSVFIGAWYHFIGAWYHDKQINKTDVEVFLQS